MDLRQPPGGTHRRRHRRAGHRARPTSPRGGARGPGRRQGVRSRWPRRPREERRRHRLLGPVRPHGRPTPEPDAGWAPRRDAGLRRRWLLRRRARPRPPIDRRGGDLGPRSWRRRLQDEDRCTHDRRGRRTCRRRERGPRGRSGPPGRRQRCLHRLGRRSRGESARTVRRRLVRGAAAPPSGRGHGPPPTIHPGHRSRGARPRTASPAWPRG